MTTEAKHRIIIAAGEDLFRDLLGSVLAACGNVEVIGSFAEGEAAIEAARRLRPRLALLDIELRGTLNGIQTGIRIRREFPETGIIWLSAQSGPFLPVPFRQNEHTGWGYLLKKSATDVRALSTVIDGVARGLLMLDPAIAHSMNFLLKEWRPLIDTPEYDILALMTQGLGNTAIAQTLELSEPSIEHHINQIFKRFQHLREERQTGAAKRAPAEDPAAPGTVRRLAAPGGGGKAVRRGRSRARVK